MFFALTATSVNLGLSYLVLLFLLSSLRVAMAVASASASAPGSLSEFAPSSSASAYISSSSRHLATSSGSSEQLSSKYFSVAPADVYVIEGESAELKCQISPHADAGPVQWAKDGFLLGELILNTHYYLTFRASD